MVEDEEGRWRREERMKRRRKDLLVSCGRRLYALHPQLRKELLPSQQTQLDRVTRRSVGRENDCAVEEGTKGRSTTHWQSAGSHRRLAVRKVKSRRMMRTTGDW